MTASPLPLEPEPGFSPRHPTSLTSWGLAMARALEGRGCNAPRLFARAGLDFSALHDPDARYPVKGTALLWGLAVEATGDPCFGIEVARHTTPMTFHALGFSLAASGSVREAFERVVRYYRLVSDAAAIRFESRGETYRVSVRTWPRVHPSLEAIDAVLAVAVRLCRSPTDRQFSPLAVELQRPAPPDPTPFFRYFRAPVTFDADEDALTLPKDKCDERIQGANPELARANDRIAAEALARWESSHLADRVRVVLLDSLPNGAQSQAAGRAAARAQHARPAAKARRGGDVVRRPGRRHATRPRPRVPARSPALDDGHRIPPRLLGSRELHQGLPALDGQDALGLPARRLGPRSSDTVARERQYSLRFFRPFL